MNKEQLAEDYANKQVPNADKNDAPYYTTSDRWQDAYDAFIAGYSLKEGAGTWVDEMLKLLNRASELVGNPGTNISLSTDISCDNWQDDYEKFNAAIKQSSPTNPLTGTTGTESNTVTNWNDVE